MKYIMLFANKDDMYPEFVPADMSSDEKAVAAAKTFMSHARNGTELIAVLEGDVRVVYPPRGKQ
jgi:hypothetical protein